MRIIDERDFTDFLKEQEKIVYSICLAFVKNPYDAEDLSQEAFYAAFRKFSSFDGKNAKAWIGAIAANKCRDYLKNPARRTLPVENETLAVVQDPAPSVSEQVERAGADSFVRDLCLQLKEPYRAVALAYYCDDASLTEIAQASGENIKTVATRLYRARAMLKNLIQEDP